MKSFLSEIRATFAATVCLLIACTGIYPAAVLALGQVLWPSQAHGSLLSDSHGTVRGSRWIGQRFTGASYFHSRPSAAGAEGYDATASGGANLGPTSRALSDAIRTRADDYRRHHGMSPSSLVPADAVTTSASGLDPHISVENARLQAPRVARERGLSESTVLECVRRNTLAPAWGGLLGPARVEVLPLNLELDRLTATPRE